MAIVYFESHNAVSNPSGWADGAYCPINSGYDFPMVIWEEYKGLCIREYENNGYNDSDFFMVVWDEKENKPSNIKFGTTRFWCGPSMSSAPDASPEVLEKYDAWRKAEAEKLRKKQRKDAADDLREFRKKVSRVAKEYDLPYIKLMRLAKISKQKGVDIMNLFGGRIRSKFKLSIREQITNWLKEESPKYNFPLSPKQMMYL